MIVYRKKKDMKKVTKELKETGSVTIHFYHKQKGTGSQPKKEESK